MAIAASPSVPLEVSGVLPPPVASAKTRSRLLSDNSQQQKAFRLGGLEPASLMLIGKLAGPAVIAGTLLLSLRLNGLSMSLEYVTLALSVFLVADRVLDLPDTLSRLEGPQLRPAMRRLLLGWLCFFLPIAALLAALPEPHTVPYSALLGWFLLTPVGLLLSTTLARSVSHWVARRHHAPVDHIIIGVTEVGLELAKRVEAARLPGKFLGFFDFRDPERLKMHPQRWAGACSNVADFVRQQQVGAIYIALPISSAPRIADLLQQLRDTTASIYFVPNLIAFDLVQPRCIDLHGIPALAVCETPFRGMDGLTKRLVDVVASSIGLLLAAPAMVAIALAVKLTSPGPVLFKQRRYGLNGEQILVYKYRSMTVCEDGGLVTQATRNDQRITPVGRFLRKTSLDELPQLLNVLQGKMSMVGPRPHAVAHNETYRKLISGYMIRHKVRPGITGWAQVNGLRGETETIDKMRARIEYDIDYLKNWSCWLDIKILVRTALLVLGDQEAY